jgi:hypothetical protein
MDPLALQSTLHVREGDDDGVHGAVGHLGSQLIDGERGVGLAHSGAPVL